MPRVHFVLLEKNSRLLPLLVRTVPLVNFNTKTTNLRRLAKRVALVNTVRRRLWCVEIVKWANIKM